MFNIKYKNPVFVLLGILLFLGNVAIADPIVVSRQIIRDINMQISKCIVVADTTVCKTSAGDVLIKGPEAANGLTPIPLVSQDRSYVALDFQCNQSPKPFCLIRARSTLAVDQHLLALFKLELQPNLIRLVSDGDFKFGPPLNGNLILVDSSKRRPSFLSFEDARNRLVEVWTSEKFGLIEGVVQLSEHRSNRSISARFQIDPIAKTSTLFLPGIGEIALPFAEMRSFQFGTWSLPFEGANFLWGTRNDFLLQERTESFATLLNLQFMFSKSEGIKLKSTLIRLPQSDAIIQSRPPQVDRQGDVYLVVGTAKGSAVEVICKNNNGSINLETVIQPSLDTRLLVRASPLIDGVEVVREAPGKQLSFQHLSLLRHNRSGLRPCGAANPTVTQQIYANLDFENGARISSDNFFVYGDGPENHGRSGSMMVVSKSRVTTPTSIIVDIYGASGGTPRAANEAVPTFVPSVDEHWVAQAILPGDGDLGRRFAMSAATPNRSKSLEALNRLSEKLVERYPSLSGSITLRSNSAGATIAIQAVLSRPDLYSGAILFSGAFDWVAINPDPEISGFHSVADQTEVESAIANVPEHCYGSKLLIFHAKDDQIASFGQAEAFVGRLKAKNCLVGTVFTTAGGHSLSSDLMQPEEAITFQNAVDQRGSQPLLKDLVLARRLSNK